MFFFFFFFGRTNFLVQPKRLYLQQNDQNSKFIVGNQLSDQYFCFALSQFFDPFRDV